MRAFLRGRIDLVQAEAIRDLIEAKTLFQARIALQQAMGSGLNSQGRVLAVHPITGDLYVGGWFTQAGGSPASRIAYWDGSAWHPLGSGLSGGETPLSPTF